MTDDPGQLDSSWQILEGIPPEEPSVPAVPSQPIAPVQPSPPPTQPISTPSVGIPSVKAEPIPAPVIPSTPPQVVPPPVPQPIPVPQVSPSITQSIPTPPPSNQPSPIKTRRMLPIWLWAIAGLAIVAGILVALSEYGVMTIGVEQYWGLSNIAEKALPVASSALAQAKNYRVTGKVTIDQFALLSTTAASNVANAGTANSAGSLVVEFVQDRAGGVTQTTGNATYKANPGKEQALGTLFAGGAPVAFQIIQSQSDLYLNIKDIDGVDKWTKVSVGDLYSLLGFKAGSWSGVIGQLAPSLVKGSRLPKQSVENVSTKGYHTVIAADSLAILFSSKLQLADTNQLDVVAQLGIGDKRPYAITLTGPVTDKSFSGNLKASLNLSAFGQISEISLPANDKLKTRSLPIFMSEHGLFNTNAVANRDVQRKADLQSIAVALAVYATAQKPFQYPKTDDLIHLDKESVVGKALASVLPDLPHDPLAGDRFYGYRSDGASFQLTTALENTGDPAGKAVGAWWIFTVSSQP